jgi:hypothetical protein
VDDVLDFELLNNQDISISEANEAMKMLEQKSIKRVLEFKNCVYTVSRNTFISNDNFKWFSNTFKVFVNLSKSYFMAHLTTEDKYKIEQELLMFDKINQLIKINSHITIDKDINTVEQIASQIILQLKKS